MNLTPGTTITASNGESSIDLIETGIAELLKDRLPFDALIEVFPNDPEQFDFANLNLVALVQYTGSAYAVAKGLPQGSQSRAMAITIHLSSRDLRGAEGGYRLIEATRNALQGMRGGPSGQIDILSDGLVEERGEAGFYHFEMRIACSTQAVAGRLQPHPRTVTEQRQAGVTQ